MRTSHPLWPAVHTLPGRGVGFHALSIPLMASASVPSCKTSSLTPLQPIADGRCRADSSEVSAARFLKHSRLSRNGCSGRSRRFLFPNRFLAWSSMQLTNLEGYYGSYSWWKTHAGIFRRRHWRPSKCFRFWKTRVLSILRLPVWNLSFLFFTWPREVETNRRLVVLQFCAPHTEFIVLNIQNKNVLMGCLIQRETFI